MPDVRKKHHARTANGQNSGRDEPSGFGMNFAAVSASDSQLISVEISFMKRCLLALAVCFAAQPLFAGQPTVIFKTGKREFKKHVVRQRAGVNSAAINQAHLQGFVPHVVHGKQIVFVQQGGFVQSGFVRGSGTVDPRFLSAPGQPAQPAFNVPSSIYGVRIRQSPFR